VTQSVGNGETAYQFTGEMRDANGLIYLRARYYAPQDGRFTQRDPSGLEANLYLYAGANPVTNTDPSGYFYDRIAAISFARRWDDPNGNAPFPTVLVQ